ncbi:MAG: alpha/beta hydrolase [Simkaniaceae bacterium]
MALHKKIEEIIAQTEQAHLPLISEQSLKQMRESFHNLKRLQGDVRALPKVETFSLKTPTHEIPARIYCPHLGKSEGVILYFHGGNFVKGDIETFDTLMRDLAFYSNSQVLSIGYRLAPEHPFPAALDDALFAYKWLVSEIDRNKSFPKKIALAGDNAGGNLVASLTHQIKGEKIQPCFQVLIYPFLDFTFNSPSHTQFKEGYLLEESSLIWYRKQLVPRKHPFDDPMLSPLFHKNFKNLPPALIITAEYDPLRDDGESYADRLKEASIPVKLHRFDGMTHGFFQMATILESGRKAIYEVSEEIKKKFSAILN